MDTKDNLRRCRVCGLLYPNYFPWGESGKDPTFDICDSCGAEWGYQDSLPEGAIRYRKNWLESGAKWKNDYAWSKNGHKPENWNLIEQLKQIPQEYRDGYLEEYIKNHS